MKIVSLLWPCSCTFIALADDIGPRVVTRDGVVEGRALGEVRAYLGVPYAAPPVGKLRWRPPAPVVPWEGVRPAKEFGPRCPQPTIWRDMVFRDAGPSEDCLTLNVWTPASGSEEGLPVLVWIHGGGMVSGGSSEATCDGRHLAARGAVVVSMNYRLGIFGFLIHPELIAESPYASAGNYGLLDQLAALRWVRDNIRAFGGDPGRVAIFGHSAGANCVDAHMASPLARGLFQRAIGQSGSNHDTSPLPDTTTLAEKAARVAAFLRGQGGATTLAELRALPVDRLLALAAHAGEAGLDLADIVADGHHLPAPVDAVFSSGAQNDVPLIISWTREESIASLPREVTAETLATFVRTYFPKTADEILRFYPGEDPGQARRSLARLADDHFTLGLWQWLRQQTATGRQPACLCSFDRAPAAAPGQRPRGAVHSSELPYVFGTFDAIARFAWTEEDRALGAFIQRYWINFARDGNPNGPGLPEWPAYAGPEGKRALYLDLRPEAKTSESEDRHALLARAVAAERSTPAAAR